MLEASEAQMPGGGHAPVMACMPYECRLRSHGRCNRVLLPVRFRGKCHLRRAASSRSVFQRLNAAFPLCAGRSFLGGALEGIAPYVARLRGLFWSVLCRRRAGALVRANGRLSVSGETTGGILDLRRVVQPCSPQTFGVRIFWRPHPVLHIPGNFALTVR
ncbi:hypothetical protein KCP73_02290 [Salmonella enterica subsp. enterica]|nr:hypothetical protein KCP73_02290 [Salmonella enterica subsp. enterica]